MDDLNQLRYELLSDFFLFTQVFFKEETGRDFIISKPVSSESHFREIARALEDVFYGRTQRLIINCPPGWAKSLFVKSFIAWATAHYPDANHLYISYSHELASSHTHSIKNLMNKPLYHQLFNVSIPRDSSAKDFFKTTQGGAVAAFGSAGAITGRDAGLPGVERYSGGVFIDDIHKPDHVHSDVIRENIKKNYFETIEPRLRGFNVPIVFIGQRLHEDDLFSHLMSGSDGHDWTRVIIKAEDDAGNPRYPEVLPAESIKAKKIQEYVWASQYMQEPVPSGGALFKEDNFPLLENEPDILATFITADTAETEHEWNDKTVFSFWGLYEVKFKNVAIPNMYALHWLDCWEINVEPKDLEANFLDFWGSCLQHRVKPQLAIIEKKSTGVTLVSVLKNTQGIKVIGMDRTIKSGSKSDRFITMQQYIGNKQVSLPLYGKHTKMCVDHMKKITANNTHRWDDICDTVVDAVNAAFIDKIIIAKATAKTDYSQMAAKMAQGRRHIDHLRMKAYGSSQNLSR